MPCPHDLFTSMIQVRVRLYATLRAYASQQKLGEPQIVQLPDGATVKQLIAALGIPDNIVRKVFSQGRAVEEDHVLRDGEDIGMFPPVAGG